MAGSISRSGTLAPPSVSVFLGNGAGGVGPRGRLHHGGRGIRLGGGRPECRRAARHRVGELQRRQRLGVAGARAHACRAHEQSRARGSERGSTPTLPAYRCPRRDRVRPPAPSASSMGFALWAALRQCRRRDDLDLQSAAREPHDFRDLQRRYAIPAGTGSAALSTALGPHIASIHDVPNDQGGHVELRWDASPLDRAPNGPISQYKVWRQLPSGYAAQQLTSGSRHLADPAMVRLERAICSSRASALSRSIGNTWRRRSPAGTQATASPPRRPRTRWEAPIRERHS